MRDVRLGSDFQSDSARGCLGVIDSLGTSLDIAAHAVVVARRVGAQVSETVEGDGVLGSAVSESGGVAGHLALGNVERGFGTNQEAITSKDSVGGDGGALGYQAIRCQFQSVRQR